SLAYSSRNGSGQLGVGWSLSAGGSQIRRCGSTQRHDGLVRPVQISSADHFCLDGARLIPVGTNEYRTEPDGNARIVYLPGTNNDEQWIVYAKDGRILHYGSTANSRLDANFQSYSADDTLTTTRARLGWLLDTVNDRVGNYMSYVYDRGPWGTPSAFL